MAHHHIDPLSGLSSSSQAENSPSPPNHAPPPGTFTTALAVLQEDQQANLFITPDPSLSLEQAILAVNTTTIAVDRFPSVSPNTALAMHMVNTDLPAFTTCYAQDERTVRLGAFECEGGSSGACLATAV